MTAITITKSPSYSTSDGSLFTDRKLAVAHEVFLKRAAALEVVIAQAGVFSVVDADGENAKNLAAIIARNGAKFLEALTVKQQGGRKAKQATLV